MQDLLLVRDPLFLKHTIDEDHVENATRLSTILELFEERPEWKKIPTLTPKPISELAATRLHSKELFRQLLERRNQEGWLDPDTYFGKDSIEVALSAAGAAVDAALEIWKGDKRRGFVLVRPPGHHATPTRAMGFCLLNNVALAAAAIRAESPQARVAIVDFDLHHGNGTQDAFYATEEVLFISSHRYPFYPGSGSVKEMGEGKGKGTTVNYPLAERFDSNFFISLYGQLVAEKIRAFQPDFILVSAGYDGHTEDPMYGFRINTDGYAKLTEILLSLAEERNGKILFCLEGGYNPVALKDSVAATIEKMISFPREKKAPQIKISEYPEWKLFR